MCGIVAYDGAQPALEVVVEGLRRLEYRGYDSAEVTLTDFAGNPTEGKRFHVDWDIVAVVVPPRGRAVLHDNVDQPRHLAKSVTVE